MRAFVVSHPEALVDQPISVHAVVVFHHESLVNQRISVHAVVVSHHESLAGQRISVHAACSCGFPHLTQTRVRYGEPRIAGESAERPEVS
jgi:hypothetical protein